MNDYKLLKELNDKIYDNILRGMLLNPERQVTFSGPIFKPEPDKKTVSKTVNPRNRKLMLD